MNMVAYLKKIFVVPFDRPELAQAQMLALSKQIPLLYFLLITNTIFVAFTHHGFAPPTLTLYLPGAFLCICFARLVGWWNMRHVIVSGGEAVKRLRATVLITAGFGILMIVWATSLFPYGGPEERTHVTLFMAVTIVSCIFCLTHLRPAAITLALVSVTPFAFYFVSLGTTVMTAIAFNVVLVTCSMIYTLSIHFGEFNTMVEQRNNLEKTHAETLRLSEENLKYANLDSLTGMPNRRRFFAELESILKNVKLSDKNFAVGLIDLDGFKAVNDLYGHSVGDELLMEATRRMQAQTEQSAFIARLGGDEFGFILQCDEQASDALKFANLICEVLRLPYALGDITIDISASCGIATLDDGECTGTKLLEFADYALYQAKAEATGRTVIFLPKHHEQLRVAHQINQALRGADFEKEFSLQFQPVIDVTTGRNVAYEALARWTSPIVGEISPAKFIVFAERSNLIDRLTLVLFKKFLTHLKLWPEHISASFNLSARNLTSPELALQIITAICSSGVSPRRIEFEVTETAVMADFERALKTLTLLRNLGTRIALDDFGAGYSSLGYVHRLPLDKIKIDRSFIVDIHKSEKAKNIVRTIVDMCRNLGVPCVAEGVESEIEALAVTEAGCTLVQGYFFSRPMPASVISQSFQPELEFELTATGS